MEESLSEYMLRRFCSAYPTVPITLSKVKAYLDTVDVSDYEDVKKLYVDYRSRDIGERIYNIVSTNLCPTSYRNYYSFSERDRIERCLKAALNNNYVILEIDRNYVSKRLGDIFSSKEELVKHLMEQ